jgi:hypothetical protein
LKDLWTATGDADLAEIAQLFGELASKLQLDRDHDEEVSPHIYVMF